MLRTYTEKEMLDYWKRHLGLKASGALSGSEDLTELDRRLLDDIDAWYSDLLENAPDDRVPVEDICTEVGCVYRGDNTAVIQLPPRAVRMVSLKMKDWESDQVETYSVYSDMARLQNNRLTRACVDDPVVIRRPGYLEAHGLAPHRTTEVKYPVAGGAVDSGPTAGGAETLDPDDRPYIDHLRVVVRPPKGEYTLDSTLLRRSTLLIH